MTARLVMNLLLMREGYPPTIIMRVNRRQYYNVLARADAGEETPLVNFVGRAVERSLTLYLEACTPSTEPPTAMDEWIPLREAAEGTPYSQEYLSLLARKGRLEAIKRGRNWYTTRAAIDYYERRAKNPTPAKFWVVTAGHVSQSLVCEKTSCRKTTRSPISGAYCANSSTPLEFKATIL